MKEQQTEIEAQRKEIDDLRSQLAALRKLVCASEPDAAICKEK